MAPAKYDRGIDAGHGGSLCDQPRHPKSAGRGLRPGKLVQRVQAVALQWKKGRTALRYDRLSLSEKIRAGMEVSELIKRLTGRNYPVFVDNMESVDDLANVRPTGQIIMAKCVSNAPLQVRPIKPIVFAEQRAA